MTPAELKGELDAHGVVGSYARKAESFGVHETTMMRWLKGELPIPRWVPVLLRRLPKKRKT